jgi:Protein of unknown function/Domain of unknown function (DUF1835)
MAMERLRRDPIAPGPKHNLSGMRQPTLHVAPGLSAAGSMRMAARMDGRDDEVIGLPDSLSFGPIDYADPKTRSAWVEDVLGYDWHDVVEESGQFWNRVLTTDKQRVLWFSRRSAMEYTAFLEGVWRLSDAPYSVVDITDLPIIRWNNRREKLPPQRGACVSLISHEAMLDSGLLDKAVPITEAQKAAYRALWAELRAENAPFRVVDAQGIHSAPLTFFDDMVRSCVITEWRKCARVIGEALGKDWESGYHQVGDMELFSRLRKLVELGAVESDGDMSDMRQSRVRIAAT